MKKPNSVPYGSMVDATGAIVPDPAAADTLKLIGELLDAGKLNYTKIADELTERNIPSPRGGKWTYRSIKVISERWFPCVDVPVTPREKQPFVPPVSIDSVFCDGEAVREEELDRAFINQSRKKVAKATNTRPSYEYNEVHEAELAAAVIANMDPEARSHLQLMERDSLPKLPPRTWPPVRHSDIDPVTTERMKPLHYHLDALLAHSGNRERDPFNKKELRNHLNALSKWVSSLVMETYRLRDEVKKLKS